MPPVESLVVLSLSSLIGLAIIAAFAAWGWQGWLKLQRHQIDHTPLGHGGDIPAVANRIDLADMRERIRKLEAIAAGVDI